MNPEDRAKRTMPKQIWTECPACQYREPWEHPLFACPECGGEWLDARYDYAALQAEWPDLIAGRPFTMWRYWDLLPLHDPANILTRGEAHRFYMRPTSG
jgi:threonine synthase